MSDARVSLGATLAGMSSRDDLVTSELPAMGGTPAQERALRAQGKKTVRKLLSAGTKVFARRGYHAARVDDIVKLAETSHGTFYLYFSNKEDLLNTLIMLCRQEMTDLLDTLGPVTPDEDGYRELRSWLDRFVSLYERYGPVVRAWTEAAETTAPEFAQAGAEMLGDFTTRLSKHVAEANPGGRIDPWLASVAFVAMIERVHYFVTSRQIEFDEEQLLDTLATIIHTGVFGGPR